MRILIMDNTPKYIYNNDLDKKYVNVKIVKNNNKNIVYKAQDNSCAILINKK